MAVSTLHLLEKLVEWKRCSLRQLEFYLYSPLHLLEKLVEWKHFSWYVPALEFSLLFTCWRN